MARLRDARGNVTGLPLLREVLEVLLERSGETTLTLNSILEWSTPHSSAHLPGEVPSLLGVTSKALVWPGMTSCFMRNGTTQKEWMTSREVRTKRTVLPLGGQRVGPGLLVCGFRVPGIAVVDTARVGREVLDEPVRMPASSLEVLASPVEPGTSSMWLKHQLHWKPTTLTVTSGFFLRLMRSDSSRAVK
ncbi:hypothetical protein SVIOM342S_03867 [Streptomyces violaceorubidus]